jgi:hypothetical protein
MENKPSSLLLEKRLGAATNPLSSLVSVTAALAVTLGSNIGSSIENNIDNDSISSSGSNDHKIMASIWKNWRVTRATNRNASTSMNDVADITTRASGSGINNQFT